MRAQTAITTEIERRGLDEACLEVQTQDGRRVLLVEHDVVQALERQGFLLVRPETREYDLDLHHVWRAIERNDGPALREVALRYIALRQR